LDLDFTSLDAAKDCPEKRDSIQRVNARDQARNQDERYQEQQGWEQ
jgi:hypothetical protein